MQKKYGLMAKVISSEPLLVLTKDAGFDFIFYDMEHSYYQFETLHSLMLFGNVIGLDSFVRARRGDSGNLSVLLDCGAKGVMLPMVETVEEASLLASFTKYPPMGKRSYSSGANTLYRTYKDHQTVMEEANKEITVIAQIESQLGVDNASEIAKVRGIDALLIGPVDLSISLGLTDQFTHEKMLESIGLVADACRSQGKQLGIIGQRPLIERYYQDLSLIINSIDTNLIRSAFAHSRSDVEQIGRNMADAK